MGERLAFIRLTKSVLLIPEQVLWKHIPANEIEAGIRRGKGWKRSNRVDQYEAKRQSIVGENVGNEKQKLRNAVNKHI